MVMKMLSRMLNDLLEGFDFNLRYEAIELTRMCFDDDLMIFCSVIDPH